MNNNEAVNQIVAIVTNNLDLPWAATGPGAVVETVIGQVGDIIGSNIDKILDILRNTLIVGGLAAMVPALILALVIALGFTANGVAAGSLAALIQSIFYGPATGGIFAALQSFGATAAPSIGAAVGGGAVAAGAWLVGKER